MAHHKNNSFILFLGEQYKRIVLKSIWNQGHFHKLLEVWMAEASVEFHKPGQGQQRRPTQKAATKNVKPESW